MVMIDAIFSAYTSALGGANVVLTILILPAIYTMAFVFYKISLLI